MPLTSSAPLLGTTNLPQPLSSAVQTSPWLHPWSVPEPEVLPLCAEESPVPLFEPGRGRQSGVGQQSTGHPMYHLPDHQHHGLQLLEEKGHRYPTHLLLPNLPPELILLSFLVLMQLSKLTLITGSHPQHLLLVP